MSALDSNKLHEDFLSQAARRVLFQDLEHRCHVEVAELQFVGRPVVEGGVALLEQRRHLRVDGAEHEETAGDARGPP